MVKSFTLAVFSLLIFTHGFEVFAQALTVDQQRSGPRRIFRFLNQGTPLVPYEGSYDSHGFKLTMGLEPQTLDCQRITDFGVELALLLDQKQERMGRWESFLSRCSLGMRNEFQLIFFLNTLDFDDDNALSSYLKDSSLSQERSEQVMRLFKKARDRASKTREHLVAFEELLKLDLDDREPHEIHRILNYYLQKAQDWRKSAPYMAQLMEMAISLRADNGPRARRLLEEFLNMHAFRIIFEIDPDYFNEEWTKERHVNLFLELGLLVSKHFRTSNPVELDIFMTLLMELNRSRIFDSLANQYGTDWSLIRLRESMGRKFLGRRYPSFWFQQLSFRTSSALIEGYIERLMSQIRDRDSILEFMWIFNEEPPRSEQSRQLLLEAAANVGEDHYLNYVVLELLQSSSFKNDLAKLNPHFSRSLFNLQREYYRGLLHQGVAKQFTVMRLLQLGDQDTDYLWFLAFNP